jgi:hypothetical protein
MTQPWYATREDIKAELDVKETARANARIDRALEDASRAVEALTHRRFYPEQDTRTWDWPNGQNARSWRIWLDSNEVISITSLTVGGQTQAPGTYFPSRSDGRDEPPYTRLELDLDGPAAFGGGTPTQQRNIALTALFGYRNDETTAGALAAPVNSASTGTVTVDANASAGLGVGSLLRVDAERMVVTGRRMLDTGQNLGGSGLTNQPNNVAVTVTDGTGFAVDEVLLIESERMLIVDIAGTTLTVRRAWDGSTIAPHASGVDIYAPRLLTVARGALGTTAATHTSGATVARWDAPGPVRQLTVAEALNDLLQGRSGYARTAGTGENEREMSGRGLKELRDRVYTSHGRKARLRGV